VIYEMSKDSAHFRNEQRKQTAVDEKIARLRARAAGLAPPELAGHARAADARVAALEARRDLTRSWLHVDMDVSWRVLRRRAQEGGVRRRRRCLRWQAAAAVLHRGGEQVGRAPKHVV
jgi:hypothetical protein